MEGPGGLNLACCSSPRRLASVFPIISDRSRAELRSDQIRSLCRFFTGIHIHTHKHTTLTQPSSRQTLSHVHSPHTRHSNYGGAKTSGAAFKPKSRKGLWGKESTEYLYVDLVWPLAEKTFTPFFPSIFLGIKKLQFYS